MLDNSVAFMLVLEHQNSVGTCETDINKRKLKDFPKNFIIQNGSENSYLAHHECYESWRSMMLEDSVCLNLRSMIQIMVVTSRKQF